MEKIERINDLPISIKNLVLINIAEQNNLERAILLESKNSLIKWSFDFYKSNEGKKFWEEVLNWEIRYADSFRFDKKYQRKIINLTPDVKIKRLSKNDIITEIVDYYSYEPTLRRSTFNGKHKAVHKVFVNGYNRVSPIGKCVTTYNRKWLIDRTVHLNYIENNITMRCNVFNVDDILDERYRGHCVEFWTDLETLHYHNLFWTDRRLSDRGQRFVDELRKKWHSINGEIISNDYKIVPYKAPIIEIEVPKKKIILQGKDFPPDDYKPPKSKNWFKNFWDKIW